MHAAHQRLEGVMDLARFDDAARHEEPSQASRGGTNKPSSL